MLVFAARECLSYEVRHPLEVEPPPPTPELRCVGSGEE